MVLEFIQSMTPLLAFLLVTVILFGVLQKTKILGDNKAVSLIISAVIGLLFIIVPKSVDFTNSVFPIFTAFILFVVILVMVVTFTGGDLRSLFGRGVRGFVWAVIIIMLVIFIFSAVKVSPEFQTMMTNPTPFWNGIIQPIIFFAIFALVAWFLTRTVAK
jgi:D-alanyl-lipoteichoic acid acyltransferase DltB (MBOAT superfamily)